ncbi:hypothetical protein [Novosphingobium terrae]|uniref:hypothetical protein n=1 Tax=Novosphingobium terrae TaxID=2726189 RepID=UPI001F1301FB|nr:hypothetical protein [Novosphingobium terrae]
MAASAYAVIFDRKVAGLYDFTAQEHLRVAAESREGRVQGNYEGRPGLFGGTLPELFDATDQAFVSLEVDGYKVKGYDRASGHHYEAEILPRLIQLYDHGAQAWFSFEPQIA